MKINAVLDKILLDAGVKHYHQIDFAKSPHLMTIGASGSGKTYLNKQIIAKTALHIPDSQIIILDFKADDYHFARSTGQLYEFDKCIEGLECFYNTLLDRQHGQDDSRGFRLLVIEELSSMISYYDKKTVERIKSMLTSIVLMGRSFNTHTLISTQRPDSNLFNSGVRDSISIIIAMGNMSKEGKSMMFKGFEDDLQPVYTQGGGYMLINSTNLHRIQVPLITNTEKMQQSIIDGLNR